MGIRLHSMQGYPFLLDVEVDYALGVGGLAVTTTTTNAGVRPCPYGAGQHPYLSPGVGLIDECTLQLSAGTRIVTHDERQLPTATEPVDGTPYDFREPRLLGATTLDFAFTELARDADGRAWARLGGTTADRQSSGWTTATRSSSSTPATPSRPSDGAGASAPSR